MNKKMKLSNTDKMDLEKYTKLLVFKVNQVIVQSRTSIANDILNTPCLEFGRDWFNLNVIDIPQVTEWTKTHLVDLKVLWKLPMCVSISLETVEQDKMELEFWCLRILPEQSEPTGRLTHTVFNRMGLLLKSIVSITRVLPAYRLAKRQDPDSYQIKYSINLFDPPLNELGDGYKEIKVGQIGTPIGTLLVCVYYRTKLAISPTKTAQSKSIMVKSDHFNTNVDSNKTGLNSGDDRSITLDKTRRIGAFVDKNLEIQEHDIAVPLINFGSLFINEPDDKENEEYELQQDPLLNDSVEEQKTDVKEDENMNDTSQAPTSATPTLTMTSTTDDFIMVDLKTPFASTDSNSELGNYFREWQTAPPLQEYIDLPPLEELDVARQLEFFESESNKFDSLVQELCQSSNNN